MDSPRPLRLRRALAFAWLAALLAPAVGLDARAEPARARPQRPLFSSPATPIDTGSFQVELGYAFSRMDTDETRHLAPLALRVQPLDWLEARAFWAGPGEFRLGGEQRRAGVGDFGFGAAAYLTRESRWAPAIASLLTVTLPFGTQGLSADATRIEGRVMLEKSVARVFGIGLNAGFAALVPRDDGPTALRLPLSLTVVGHLFDLVDLVGELYGEFDLRTPRAAPEFGARAVVMVWALDQLAIDVGVDFGVTEPAPNIGARVGLTWNVGRLF